MTPRNIWIVLTDAHRADVYRCRATPSHGWRMSPGARLDNAHVGEHERGRPTQLDDHPTAIRGGPHESSSGREREEVERRFALELFGRTGWVWARVATDQEAEVHVFAPPRFLGVIRAVMPTHGRAASTELHAGELVGAECADLLRHPRITEILGRSAPV